MPSSSKICSIYWHVRMYVSSNIANMTQNRKNVRLLKMRQYFLKEDILPPKSKRYGSSAAFLRRRSGRSGLAPGSRGAEG